MSSRYDVYASRYPLLPLKNVVIFPRNVVTLQVGRSRSIQAVEESLNRDRRLVVVAHRDSSAEDPDPSQLYPVGTLVEIVSVEHQSGGNIQVQLEALTRVALIQVDCSRAYYTARAEVAGEQVGRPEEAAALVAYVQELVKNHQEAKSGFSPDIVEMIEGLHDPGHLADLLTTQMVREAGQRQTYLEELDPLLRLERLATLLATDLDIASLEKRIKDRVRDQIDKNQREYYLREQLKAIHDELAGDGGSEMDQLREQIQARGFPEPVVDKLQKEVTRLERMPTVSAEGTVVRTYIDTMLALPWREETSDNLDLDHAEEILEHDHYGLEQVKERIIEFLAVRKLTAGREPGGAAVAQILCLVGPPGVGKTSLGRSIAQAMGREFVRISLGGVRDEAEIRGHRRTYIGAFPGRIVGAIKTAGTINPVIVLDEVDKLASDYRGDPASALLEVLDPEQNHAFVDHYLEVVFDLSKVLFIATANSLAGIPRPLRDRMEIIEVGGYTEAEKLEIGRRHLSPKQVEAHGLKPSQLEIPEKVWIELIRHYTHEAGVRGLERQLASICRKVARDTVKEEKAKRIRLTPKRLEEYLGPPRYGFDHQIGEDQVGVAIGLGATDIGGELVPVEVATMPGRGNLTITGQAGDVMQESARAALSYARSRSVALGIAPDFQEHYDLHIHLPEGAIPKDGPSAGITMATALISALTKRPVHGDVAMTGEITLRGRVLPIGGLKEKTLAAHRVGIHHVIAPVENQHDVVKLPEKIRAEMEFTWVENMDQVIARALDLDTAIPEIDPSLRERVNELAPAGAAELPQVARAQTDVVADL